MNLKADASIKPAPSVGFLSGASANGGGNDGVE